MELKHEAHGPVPVCSQLPPLQSGDLKILEEDTPESGLSIPPTRCRKVLLPEPLAPVIATICPVLTVSFKSTRMRSRSCPER